MTIASFFFFGGSVFKQRREFQRKPLLKFVDSQMSSAQNHPYLRVAYFGVAYFDHLQVLYMTTESRLLTVLFKSTLFLLNIFSLTDQQFRKSF